jgi:hypothetical protein
MLGSRRLLDFLCSLCGEAAADAASCAAISLLSACSLALYILSARCSTSVTGATAAVASATCLLSSLIRAFCASTFFFECRKAFCREVASASASVLAAFSVRSAARMRSTSSSSVSPACRAYAGVPDTSDPVDPIDPIDPPHGSDAACTACDFDSGSGSGSLRAAPSRSYQRARDETRECRRCGRARVGVVGTEVEAGAPAGLGGSPELLFADRGSERKRRAVGEMGAGADGRCDEAGGKANESGA